MPYKKPVALALLATLIIFGSMAAPVAAEFGTTPTLIRTNSGIFTFAPGNDRVFAGGTFASISQPDTPLLLTGATAIDATTGVASSTFPSFQGEVRTIVNDGAGGWYIGGGFTSVGGVSQQNLAHIFANGTLDTDWNPSIDAQVEAIVVLDSVVYIGGLFSQIDGQARDRLAALDADGNLTAWNPGANSDVRTLATDGTVIYAGGGFTMVAGSTREGAAAIDTSGAVTPWLADTGGLPVNRIAVFGSTVYVAGEFSTINGEARDGLASLETDGTLNAFSLNIAGDVSAFAMLDSELYLGGSFAAIEAQERASLAAIAADGTLTDWNPGTDGSVYDIALSGSQFYIAGNFSEVNGELRSSVAEVDANENVSSWSPKLYGGMRTISPHGPTVLVGGTISFIGGAPSLSLAALSADGSTLESGFAALFQEFDQVSASVLSADGQTLYLAGFFTTVDGITRNNIVALDTSDGSVISAFDPNVNQSIKTLRLSADESVLYLGGFFDMVGGETRTVVAAVTTADGSLVTTFSPVLTGGGVESVQLSPDGSILYVGGAFTEVEGESRIGLAAVRTNDGSLVSEFAPSTVSLSAQNVRSLAISPDGATLYVGGDFSSINGESRFGLAAVSTSDGALVTGFNPESTGGVYSIQLSPDGTRLYVAGNFSGIGGEDVTAVASLSPLDGSANPAFSTDRIQIGAALALSPSGRYLYVSDENLTDNIAGAVFTDPDVSDAVAPTVTAAAASGVTEDAARLNGSITATGGSNATVRGFVYGTGLPYTATTTETGSFSTGSFSASLTGLSCRTTYHYAAYAQNAAGRTYSSDATFTTQACAGGGGGSSRRDSDHRDEPAKPEDEDEQEETPVVPGTSTLTPAFSRNLTIGSTGSDVQDLQRFLNARGFTVTLTGPGSAGNETTLFGALTQAALTKFQAANGIVPASGFLGPVTRAFISALDTTVPAAPIPIPLQPARDLTIGSTGEDVRRLQQFLIADGLSVPSGATGYFGVQTQAALAAYQQKNGIMPATGYFGPKTRAHIEARSAAWW